MKKQYIERVVKNGKVKINRKTFAPTQIVGDGRWMFRLFFSVNGDMRNAVYGNNLSEPVNDWVMWVVEEEK